MNNGQNLFPRRHQPSLSLSRPFLSRLHENPTGHLNGWVRPNLAMELVFSKGGLQTIAPCISLDLKISNLDSMSEQFIHGLLAFYRHRVGH